jgi:hypothetical protein
MFDWNKQFFFPNNFVSSTVAIKVMQLTFPRIISGVLMKLLLTPIYFESVD